MKRTTAAISILALFGWCFLVYDGSTSTNYVESWEVEKIEFDFEEIANADTNRNWVISSITLEDELEHHTWTCTLHNIGSVPDDILSCKPETSSQINITKIKGKDPSYIQSLHTQEVSSLLLQLESLSEAKSGKHGQIQLSNNTQETHITRYNKEDTYILHINILQNISWTTTQLYEKTFQNITEEDNIVITKSPDWSAMFIVWDDVFDTWINISDPRNSSATLYTVWAWFRFETK